MRITFVQILGGMLIATGLVGPVAAQETAAEAAARMSGAAPANGDLTPTEALRAGTRFYYAGEKKRALDSLRFAAEQGHPLAAWKLGRMYSRGDGVKEDDIKAFEYFSQIASNFADDSPSSPRAPFIASAFVELGSYYLTGINDSAIRPNLTRAREIFTYAASYFGDADAQFHLGMLYLDERDRDTTMAARWLKLAAQKGHLAAQARLGELLFNGDFGGDGARAARRLRRPGYQVQKAGSLCSSSAPVLADASTSAARCVGYEQTWHSKRAFCRTPARIQARASVANGAHHPTGTDVWP